VAVFYQLVRDKEKSIILFVMIRKLLQKRLLLSVITLEL